MDIPFRCFPDAKLCRPEEAALLEGVELFRLRGEECPYFDDGRPRESLNFIAREIDPGVYESLLAYGWRRCGNLFYKSRCPGCIECHPLRVDALRFKLNRSQSRCMALNKAMDVSVGDPDDNDEDYELFSRYCDLRHGEKRRSREEFRAFLVNPPLPSIVIRHRLPDGRLVCAAWTDVMPSSLSAVYTVFDPDMPKLGLGVFSILIQLAFCKRSGLRHLHLGFHIPGCRKMSYKNHYAPCESPGADGVWRSYGAPPGESNSPSL